MKSPIPRLRGLLVSWSARLPSLLFALKSALAAGVSWAIVSPFFGTEAAALAVVSAVIIVQVTSWQTVSKGIQRVLGVLLGVTLAVLVSHLLGLTFWTVTCVIFLAQLIGMVVQRRGQYLATQIPISAALALVLGVSATTYPLLRLVGALVGGLVGTSLSLLLSPPIYVYRARDAIAEVTGELAGAVPRLTAALAGRLNAVETRTTYQQILHLEQRVRATEQAYTLAQENTRLDPWARPSRRLLVDFPTVLLALDRIVRQMRRIAYTVDEADPCWEVIAATQTWPLEYAEVLEDVEGILHVAAEDIRSSAQPAGAELRARPSLDSISTRIEHAQQRLHAAETHLAHDAPDALDKHDRAGPTEPTDSDDIRPPVGTAVRGALLTDLRRILDEAQDVVEMTSHVRLV